MKDFNITVKPFSTSSTAVTSLAVGRINANGSFEKVWFVKKDSKIAPHLKDLSIKWEGPYGKPSCSCTISFSIPETFRYAIAEKHLTDAGFTSRSEQWNVIYTPSNPAY